MRGCGLSVCEFSEEVKVAGIRKGRKCRLDESLCFNYGRPEIVAVCPTVKAFNEGQIIGPKTPASIYPGIPKLFRQGRYGYFEAGIPPHLLRGMIYDKKRRRHK